MNVCAASVVLVGDDVVRAEVVERLVGPGAVRELRDERARQRDRLLVIAQAAKRAQIEELRFGLARRAFEIRPHAVARGGVTFEEVVALGDAEIDDLAIVAADCRWRSWSADRASA